MSMNDDPFDPWLWTEQTKSVAPLGNQMIKPSEASMPAPAPVDNTSQQLLGLATPSINGAIKGGYEGYKAYQAGQAVAPLSANTVIGTTAPAMTSAPAMATPATSFLASVPSATGGSLVSAAPMMSTPLAMAVPATEAIAGGALATVPTAAATSTAAGAAGAGAMSGATAGLAAMGPVGWAIGAGLLAKSLGIF